MKDASTPVLAGLVATLLAGLALPDLLGALPDEPAALAGALVTIAVAWGAVVVPALSRGRPIRVVEAALVLAPALLFAVRAAPGPLLLPWRPLVAAGAAGAWAASLGSVGRARAAACAAAVLVSLPVLAAAQVFVPPAGVVVTVSALEVADRAEEGRETDPRALVPRAWSEPDPARTLRVGSLARTPAVLPAGTNPLAGARWIPVPEEALAALPAGGPIVRVVGAAAASSHVGETTVVGSPWRGELALDLDPYDAILLPGDTGDDTASAESLATFVRRGGLLVRVGPVPAWPEALARRLGRGGALEAPGAQAARAVGDGHVAWVRAPDETAALLAAGLARPRASTAFDRALAAPRAPADFERPAPAPPSRRPVAALLGAVAAVMAVASAFARGWMRLAALTGLAALGALEVVRLVPAESGPGLHAFRLEIGGPGGRRVEGLHVAAGPAGWSGLPGARPERDAGLRVLGFRILDTDSGPRLALPAGGEGWIVEEGVASGRTEGLLPVDRVPDWAVALLRRGAGGPEAFRAFAGTLPYDGPCPPGLPRPETARVVVLHPSR